LFITSFGHNFSHNIGFGQRSLAVEILALLAPPMLGACENLRRRKRSGQNNSETGEQLLAPRIQLMDFSEPKGTTGIWTI
jgi:hypothetical protein